MYVMIGIDEQLFGGDDLTFAQTLLKEQRCDPDAENSHEAGVP